MEMFRKHTSPLLVIIAGLLSCIATADAQNPSIYPLCHTSTPAVLSVTPTSEPFIIQSPNYGYGSYPNNLDCTLTFTSASEPMVLSFEYRVINLEAAQDCVFDYLCVVGVKFCGNWAAGRIFQQILPPRSNSTVYFYTDSYVTLDGFYIIVTSQPVRQIQQVQGSGWSELNITYVPANYYPGMPYTDGCRSDTVVPNGLNDTDDYTGNVTYEQTTITTQDTTTSTEEIQTQNITIAPTQQDTYYFCNNQESNNYIDINSSSSPFLIRSPHYGGALYDNNLYCSLVIRSGAEPLVLSLSIQDFQVEHLYSCVFDYLCVHGTKFCGGWLSGYKFQYILPENSLFTAIFRTDGSVNQRGFDIAISQVLARPTQGVLQPSGEVASSNDTFSNTYEIYYPGYPYSDRCVATSTEVPITSTSSDSTVFPTSGEVPLTSNIPDFTQRDTYYFCNNEQSNNYIDINSSSSPFLIRSPNYGRASYDNNLYCSFVIRSGAEPLVLSLRIKDFQVENCGPCGCDYLCVHGNKFCGAWLNGYTFQYILPENSRFTVVFRTDGSVTQGGFDIEISQELARPNQVVPQPTGEAASSNDTFSNNFETYHPGYPYSDRCVATSTEVPITSNIIDSTTVAPFNDNVCYSAAQVQQLNEIIDNAIAGLNAAREQLLRRK